MTMSSSTVLRPEPAEAAPERERDLGYASDMPDLVIKPRKGWIPVDWAELVRSHELLYFLVWRDVKVRYKHTALGAAWAVVQPMFHMVIQVLVMGEIAGFKNRLPAEMPYYPLFIYSALLPWMFFSTAINTGGMSLLNQQHLLTKIYFPRLLIPAATVGGALVDWLISFGVFAALMVYYQVVPTWQIIFVPALMLLTVVAALGIAFLLSALTVTYRDVKFLMHFMVQAWMWVSPIFYTLDMVPEKFRWLLILNPMTGVITAFRAALFPGFAWDWPSLIASVLVSGALLIFGLFYFRKTERRFADLA